jgi:hypothetical protein
MKRLLFVAFNMMMVIVAVLFTGSVGTVSSQTATATATTCAATPEAATVAPTLAVAATAQATLAANTDFSVLDAFSKLASQITQLPHQTVKSSDGEVTLLIPKGALPTNVPLSKLKISPLKPGTAPSIDCNPPLIAYNMQPDGLQFVTPVVIVVTLDPPKDGSQPLLFSVSGQTVEPLSPILNTIDPKSHKMIITAAIAHFSDVVSGNLGPRVTVIKQTGGYDQAITESFIVVANVSGPLTAPKWSLAGNWTALTPIDPSSVDSKPPATGFGVGSDYSTFPSFKCTAAEIYTAVQYTAEISYETYYKQLIQTEITRSTSLRCVNLVTHFKASFNQGEFSTHFTVTAQDPDGESLTYTWSKTNPCGDWNPGGSANEYIWHHPDSDLPGFCPDQNIHPGDIVVVVTDGHGASQTVTYKGGSGDGDCVFEPNKPGVSSGNCTITP